MDIPTRVGLGGTALFTLAGVGAPIFTWWVSGPIMAVCAVVAAWGFWPVAKDLRPPRRKRQSTQALPKDWSLYELFGHLRPDIPLKASSTVGRATFDDLDERWVPVGEGVIKQLSLGRLHATGRAFRGVRRLYASPIPPDFWQTAKFTYWFLDRLGTEILHVKNASDEQYADVEVNRAEALSIWPEEPWPDFKKWDKRKEFEFYEAACLWFNIEPRLPMPDRAIWKYQEWRNETFDGEFQVVSESVKHAIQKATRTESSVTPHTQVRKETLIGLAERDGYKPPFLYPYKRGEK